MAGIKVMSGADAGQIELNVDSSIFSVSALGELTINPAIITGLLPVGTIIPTGGATADTGYLLCDGVAYSRVTYAPLFARIGTAFGVGDGVNTFNIPDLRASVPRGAGQKTVNTRVKDGGAVGDTLEDQIQGHFHDFYRSGAPGAVNSITQGSTQNTGSDGILNPINDGTNGVPRTGAYTRDNSVSVNYQIKI